MKKLMYSGNFKMEDSKMMRNGEKKTVKISLAMSLTLLLMTPLLVVTGCAAGISQEDYDAVVAERDAAKAQIEELLEEAEPTEVVFGALISLTGDWSSSGECSQAAIEIVVEDVNDYLSSIDSDTRIRVIVEDTETDPAIALEKLKSLVERGVRVVIGPQTSAEVEAVKAYADENDILLISHSSTAPSLAIPGDNVFRFAPYDVYQADVITRVMWGTDGIKVIIPMWRGEVWGDELSIFTKYGFMDFGGTVIDGVRYEPTEKDFSVELESLSSKASQAVAQYGTDAVAVYLIAFGEAVSIFTQAQDYPVLSTIKWYGSDGTALNKELISDEQAAQFAVLTGFTSSIFGDADTNHSDAVSERISTKLGREPDTYALAAYDALWVLTQAYIDTSKHDVDTLKAAVAKAADTYFGATAWTGLNFAGDREFAVYDFWAVSEENGVFQWKLITTRPAFPRPSLTPELIRTLIRGGIPAS